ncbi:hypothetical protein [Pontibacter sp. G13]|uniref:hypothetical protein n=1 Tax=Pontibacter sp. G13 TaxID=3074898 RepID=UPI0028895E7A|nr:hypothetical protein [Pontibacter sp. G13]WNJ17382.1 hypothetical protein RJD25_21245 [Pontibacter sp. G13]
MYIRKEYTANFHWIGSLLSVVEALKEGKVISNFQVGDEGLYEYFIGDTVNFKGRMHISRRNKLRPGERPKPNFYGLPIKISIEYEQTSLGPDVMLEWICTDITDCLKCEIVLLTDVLSTDPSLSRKSGLVVGGEIPPPPTDKPSDEQKRLG